MIRQNICDISMATFLTKRSIENFYEKSNISKLNIQFLGRQFLA